MGSHIEPLARWSNGGSSRFEARAVEPRVRYAHVPLARGPVWGFSQAEAERLDLHVTLQHATRGAISSAQPLTRAGVDAPSADWWSCYAGIGLWRAGIESVRFV